MSVSDLMKIYQRNKLNLTEVDFMKRNQSSQQEEFAKKHNKKKNKQKRGKEDVKESAY